jgi:hypothetical protein
MAMFPPAMPHLFIRWLTKPGDAVYDPFSGRGTTILEACLAGRVGLASDANPLAWLLSRAKCDPPTRASITKRLRQLAESEPSALKVSAPPDIEMLFAPRVLSQLVWLQTELDRSRRVDRFLLAVLAGMLHGNADRAGVPRGLSIAMPNTFAMAPQYVRRYIKEHNLKPPVVDVLDALARRLNTFPLPGEGFHRGQAWLQNVTSPIAYPKDAPQAKLVFTSPPYLQVIKYGKFNWVRHWLLQSDPRDVDKDLFASGSLAKYLSFITQMVRNVRLVMRDDGYFCMVVGDVRQGDDELNLAREVARTCFQSTDLQVLTTIRDSLPVQHKVSRIWGATRGRATRVDRIIIAHGPNAKPLSAPERVRWAI